MDAMEETLTGIICDMTGVQAAKVVPGAKLRDDLGMDDLDIVELCMMLEDEFRVMIDDREAERKFHDVSDVLAYLRLAAGEDQ